MSSFPFRNETTWGDRMQGSQLATSQSSSATGPLTQQLPPPPRKAKKHRKRHAPPGPAGVLYQSVSLRQKDSSEADDESTSLNAPKGETHHHTADVTTCLAWMVMQLQQPHLLTPYLSPYASISERYQILRKHLPDDIGLIPEIEMGNYDLRMKNKLIVLVHSVQSSLQNCTIELRDETGSTISAWICPSFVQKERDQPPSAPKKIRTGMVWMLEGLAILPSLLNGNENKRWLLIQDQNIIKVWDSPKQSSIQQDVYLAWIEKRNNLPESIGTMTGNLMASQQEDEENEDMEIEVDHPISNVPKPVIQHQHSKLMPSQELPADFGMQILPSLHHEAHPPETQKESSRQSESLKYLSSSFCEGSQETERRNFSNPYNRITPVPESLAKQKKEEQTKQSYGNVAKSQEPQKYDGQQRDKLGEAPHPIDLSNSPLSRHFDASPKLDCNSHRAHVTPALASFSMQKEARDVDKSSSILEVHQRHHQEIMQSEKDIVAQSISTDEQARVLDKSMSQNSVQAENLKENSNPLERFAAMNKSKLQSSSPLGSKKLFSSKPNNEADTNNFKSRIKSPQRKRPKKQGTALWSTTSSSAMDMFDEDDDDEEILIENVEPSQSNTMKEQRENDESCIQNNNTSSTLLFQASKLADLDVDNLFDD